MDTLALLCNLYGDGPQTLRRLREAGCGSLATLETLESERLASLLRTSVRSARRFQAEGRLLRERSEGCIERASTRRSSAQPVAQSSPPKDVLVASVLSAWRERDARAGDGTVPVGAALAVEVPRAPLPASREGLEGLDGMDAALLTRLRECGVDSLAALREVDVLDLAGRRVAGFTRLLHLQFLARRTPECGTRGVGDSPALGAPLAVHPRAGPEIETVAALDDNEVPSQIQSPSAPLAATSRAPSAYATSDGRHETPTADDVLVPARAPERRGALRNAVPPRLATTPRFSPRSEPPAAHSLTLEVELEQHAASRRVDDPLGSGLPTQDDAGSSGPFA